MGRKKAANKIDIGHRNVGSGITGQRNMQAARGRSEGNFVGDGVGDPPAGAVAQKKIVIDEWEFLKAPESWPRAEIKEYLNKWANDLNLLSTQAQAPAFYGLCAAAMRADRWQRVLDGCGPDSKYALINMAEDMIIKSWRDCQAAVKHLDLKDALKEGESAHHADVYEDI